MEMAPASSAVSIQKFRELLGVFCATAYLASSALGCTAAPGADPIGNSNQTAWTLGFCSALFVVATVALYLLRARKGRWAVVLSLVLFAIHPAWTVSAWIGDCGHAKVEYSKWFTGALALLTIYQGIRLILARRRVEGF